MRRAGAWIAVALGGLASSCSSDVTVPPEPGPTPPSASSSGATSANRALASVARSALAPSKPKPPACIAGHLEVHEENGNLVMCSADDVRTELTTSGKDAEPTLSPDGTRVAFIRLVGTERVSLGGSDSVDIRDARVMVMTLADKSEREVAKNGACTSLAHPLWIDDGHLALHAHGLDAPTPHNKSVCFLDLKSGKVTRVADESLCVMPLRAGRYRGNAFVDGGRFVPGQGTIDWYAVVAPDGTKQKTFAENPFRRDYDGEPGLSGWELELGCDEPPPEHKAAVDAVASKL